MTKMLKATNEAIAVNLHNNGDNIEFEAYLDTDTLERYSIPLFVAWKAFAKDTSLKAELLFFENNPNVLKGIETLLNRLGEKSVKVSLETTVDGLNLNYAQGQGRGITSISVFLANEGKVAKIIFGYTKAAEERIVTVDKQEFLKAIRELLK
jgi:hypothetical protein